MSDKMSSRSFRVFGTKKDLENIFSEFQNNNIIKYYRCGKNDSNKITDITKTDNLLIQADYMIKILFYLQLYLQFGIMLKAAKKYIII